SRAKSLKVAWRNVVEEPHRGIAGIGPSFRNNATPAVPDIFHRHDCGKSDGGHAWDGGELVLNVVLDACDHSLIGNGILWNRDAQGLQTGSIAESRIDHAEFLEGADHQHGAYQKHQRQGDLSDNQNIAGPVALAACAHAACSA